jgi:hypothetical protein
MAKVTVTNNTGSRYVVPAPIGKSLNPGQTKAFVGVSVGAMNQSKAFTTAMLHGSITVVVSDDPTVPNSIEPQFLARDLLASRGANFRTDEFTNPVAAVVNAIKLSIATAATPQVFTGAQFDGATGAAEMVPPRNPTITSTSNANVTAVAAVFAGFVRNEDGVLVPQTCTINITNGGGATDVGDRPMSVITSITIPAQGGTGGALQFGFGAMIGLAALVKSRAGLIAPLRQVAVGAVVTTGTFTNAAGSVVCGYTPAAAPNATNDYAITYEVG